MVVVVVADVTAATHNISILGRVHSSVRRDYLQGAGCIMAILPLTTCDN